MQEALFRLFNTDRIDLVYLDINAHMVVRKNRKPPEDHHFSFVRLDQLGILPQPLCKDLARSVGLGNRLVHEYESIDDKIVFDSILTALQNYRSYVSAIQAYLKRNGNLSNSLRS